MLLTGETAVLCSAGLWLLSGPPTQDLRFGGVVLSVKPAVFLLSNEQRDDVSLSEAKLVGASGVREDGFHFLPFHHV